jgi:hypothetical protein
MPTPPKYAFLEGTLPEVRHAVQELAEQGYELVGEMRHAYMIPKDGNGLHFEHTWIVTMVRTGPAP